MSVEAQRCGQLAVAIPKVAIAGLVAASFGQHGTQPQHHDVAGDPPIIAIYRRQPLDRRLGFGQVALVGAV